MAATLSQTLFANTQLSIGLFDCPISSPNFNNTGPIQGYLLAFPRTAVKIKHANMERSFVADPNIVTIYNKGQEYQRFSLSAYGDRCDWISICSELVREILVDLGDVHLSDSERLFSFSHSLSTPLAYRSFRQLICYLRRTVSPDTLVIEESVLNIFRNVMETAYSNWGIRTKSMRLSTSSRHQQLVRSTQEFLALHYTRAISLDSLAKEMNTSAYHLSRVFSRLTHQSIHQYLHQLRLREALNCISKDTDLATLGIQLGFSDHSHFSQSFRKSFGVTPSNHRLYSL